MPLGLLHQRLDPIGSVRTLNANLVAHLLKPWLGTPVTRPPRLSKYPRMWNSSPSRVISCSAATRANWTSSQNPSDARKYWSGAGP
jgi:hypothetical protein